MQVLQIQNYLTLFGSLLSSDSVRLALQLLCSNVPDCVTAGRPLSGSLPNLLPVLCCLVFIAGNTRQHPESCSLAYIIFATAGLTPLLQTLVLTVLPPDNSQRERNVT